MFFTPIKQHALLISKFVPFGQKINNASIIEIESANVLKDKVPILKSPSV